MPFIFIHGVNTRDYDKNYRKNLEARNKLIQRLLIDRLAAKGIPCQNMEIVNPYWGLHGVDDQREQQSLPKVKVLQHLGGGSEILETPQSDFELEQLLESSESQPSRLQRLGGSNQRLKPAADKDLTHFIETVLSPIIFSEMNLTEEAEEDPEREGVLEALLVLAGLEVAEDPHVKSAVKNVTSDEELIALLAEKIQERFEYLVEKSNLMPPEDDQPAKPRLQQLGRKRLARWLEEATDSTREFFDRAINIPARGLTLGYLALRRERWNKEASRFLGDVFVYLKERGSKDEPGPIISTVLNDINKAIAAKRDPQEPLIIITHSMGGNIVYDILTYYKPDLRIDIWISVGGQVGRFEEMAIFQLSGEVENLKDKVGYWLNVYDPADIFSFKAADIFPNAQDVEYLTGASLLNPHDAYFKRPSFYRLLYQHIETALS
jgi:hypothetical protein